MDDKDKIIMLLEQENTHLKLQLQKYINSHKKYYEANKELVNEKANIRLKKLAKDNPDKIKEYARRAYLKQKDKKLSLKQNT